MPEDKIEKVLVSIDNALSQSSLPVRQLNLVTGSIISNMLVFGNMCKLTTKSLHRALDRREGWESRVDLDHAARKELEFWKSNVSHLNSTWPFLVKRKGGFRSFVLDSLFVENGKNVYLHGENNSTLFGSKDFSTPVFFVFCFFAGRSCTGQCPVKSVYKR